LSIETTDRNFAGSVRKYFDFLIDDYGFHYHQSLVGYVKGDLEIEFFHGKGEVEIVLFIRRDDDVFKPFVSRQFDFHKVVRRIEPIGIGFPDNLPGHFTNMEDVGKYLEYCGQLAKSCCKPIFEGDMSVLEEMHLERRGNA